MYFGKVHHNIIPGKPLCRSIYTETLGNPTHRLPGCPHGVSILCSEKVTVKDNRNTI